LNNSNIQTLSDILVAMAIQREDGDSMLVTIPDREKLEEIFYKLYKYIPSTK
jgi:hypothetical protein